MTISIHGFLLIAEFAVLRLGAPILFIALLCKILPHLCKFESEIKHPLDDIETTGGVSR